jgi:penicillin G amidase
MLARRYFRQELRMQRLSWFTLVTLVTAIALSPASKAEDSLTGAARKSLAVVSGRLTVRGLSKPVRVVRDRWGVAHIYAEDKHDLFFAQGFVAAQDRLFQMEVWKRAGQGRLSEILGASALARDVSARKLAYRGDMQAEFKSYGSDTEEILEAFTQGINEYIRGVTAPGGQGLPVEFTIAGFTPDPWRPKDCLNRMAAFSMTGNAASELEYARALFELGPSKTAKIVSFDPPVALDPDKHLELKGLTPDLLDSFVGSDQRIVFPARPIEGSNNWTIAGTRTASGKPLLANDPHRVVGLPSLRYMVHLIAPGWNVIGAGEPGLPGVALGHNENIAWGFTIFGLDQQDLYVEALNPANPREYRIEGGWKPMEVARETFKIAGEAPREVELEFTRHGPVIWKSGSRALALRWVGSEPGTAGYLSSLAIDRASSWNEFEAAVARWKVPSENIVYADRGGNIGEHSVGLAPLRHWTGLLPVPGNGEYEWAGFVPVGDLPHSYNPAVGFVATANHKMIPDRYPYPVGFEWEPAYRITRINSVIEASRTAGRKLSIEDMEALQNDVTALAAIDFQKLLETTSLAKDPALHDFLAWDGQLARQSASAALYEVWFREIGKALGKQISPQFAEHYQNLLPNVVLGILSKADAEIFGDDPGIRRDALLTSTLHAARAELGRRLGPDPGKWQWGRLHQIYFRHALDQRSTAAQELLDLPARPRPGDEFTVDATGVSPDSWEQVEGASYREIIDLGDFDRSIAINTPGQSGEPASRHYRDLAPLWDAGQYFPLSYSSHAVESVKADELVLTPGS